MGEESVMSTVTLCFEREDFLHRSLRAFAARNVAGMTTCKQRPMLRIALLHGEEFRFPSSSEWRLRILSGKAWLSFGGQDFSLVNGDHLAVPRVRNGSIISPVGEDALFLEITGRAMHAQARRARLALGSFVCGHVVG
jgi:hypothetical protein